MLIRPSPSVTGTISLKTRQTAGSRQSITHLQAAVAPAQPRERQQHLDDRPDQDRSGVDVELVVGPSTRGTPITSPAMIARFQTTGVSAGTVNWS